MLEAERMFQGWLMKSHVMSTQIWHLSLSTPCPFWLHDTAPPLAPFRLRLASAPVTYSRCTSWAGAGRQRRSARTAAGSS